MPPAELNLSCKLLLEKLIEHLPLKKRQNSLKTDERSAYIQILNTLAEQARFPSNKELTLIVPEKRIIAILDELHRQDLITKNNNEFTRAYPISTKETAHQVFINDHCLYSMCAFDAVGISDMFNRPVDIHSKCIISKEPIHLRISNKNILITNQSELQVGIHWKTINQCAANTFCNDMVFLRDKEVADE